VIVRSSVLLAAAVWARKAHAAARRRSRRCPRLLRLRNRRDSRPRRRRVAERRRRPGPPPLRYGRTRARRPHPARPHFRGGFPQQAVHRRRGSAPRAARRARSLSTSGSTSRSWPITAHAHHPPFTCSTTRAAVSKPSPAGRAPPGPPRGRRLEIPSGRHAPLHGAGYWYTDPGYRLAAMIVDRVPPVPRRLHEARHLQAPRHDRDKRA
jgi:hypothetical protein